MSMQLILPDIIFYLLILMGSARNSSEQHQDSFHEVSMLFIMIIFIQEHETLSLVKKTLTNKKLGVFFEKLTNEETFF